MGIADRWPDERRAEPGETGCYGKIASEREFVRLGIDSGDALWVVDLLTEAHALLVEANGEIPHGREVRVVICDPDSTTMLVALLRGSRDAVGRRYPLALFCCLERSDLDGRLHLAPLWLGDLWQVFGATLSSGGEQGSDDLADLIEAAEVDLLDIDEASLLHTTRLEMPAADPLALIFGSGAGRDSRLRSLVGGVRRHFEAGGDATLSIQGPIAEAVPADLVCGSARTAVVWQMLSRVASDTRPAWWGVAEVWAGADATDWQRVVFFSREIRPSDLADLLAGGSADAPEEEPVASAVNEPCGVAAVEDWCGSLGLRRESCLRDLLWDATAGER